LTTTNGVRDKVKPAVKAHGIMIGERPDGDGEGVVEPIPKELTPRSSDKN